MTLVDKALTQMNIVMSGHHGTQPAHETYNIENAINSLRNQLKDESMKEVNDHTYTYIIGTIYNDFINECEKLGDYVVNVVEARLGIS
jgi:phosphate:Na+ symporter